MDRREFLRLSFGALVASKLPQLPKVPDGDDIVWTPCSTFQPVGDAVLYGAAGFLAYVDAALFRLVAGGIVVDVDSDSNIPGRVYAEHRRT